MRCASLLLLAACAAPPRAVTTIPGVQVVAIEATPPQPAALDLLTLDTWVADGIGVGTDVLTWVCTPIDGLCAEGSPSPVIKGIPFNQWTQVSRADPRSTTTNKWPRFAGFAADEVVLPEGLEGGGLLVWALACVPGFCPVMEEVAINSAPGSEAWLRVAEGLADPARWVDAAPEGYASIAVKRIPLWDPDATTTEGGATEEPISRNGAPTLTELVPIPRGAWPPPVVNLGIVEPDGDVLQTRSFATSGLIRETFVGDDTGFGSPGIGDLIRVDWASRANDGGRPPQLFVVVEDERGASDVWSSDKGPGPDPCAAPVQIVYTTPAYPGAGLSATIPAGGSPLTATFRVTGTVPGAADTSVAIGFEMRDAANGQILATAVASGPQAYEESTCTAAFDREMERAEALTITNVCSFGGTLVDIVGTVTDGLGTPLAPSATLATGTVQAVLQIDPDLPCAQ